MMMTAGKSVPKLRMLMDRATPCVPCVKPPFNARLMEPAQTLEPCHANANFVVLHADAAFSIITGAVLLRRDIPNETCSPGLRSKILAT